LNIHNFIFSINLVVIFIIMTNNEILERIVLKMLKEEYPAIKDIKVLSYSDNGKYYYTIFLGIKYDDRMNLDDVELKLKVRNLFKLVYPHDTLHNTGFYNPEPNY
jgi:hypothetical protein